MKCVACLIVVCQLTLTAYCVVADSAGPSARLLNFASVISGFYVNSQQQWTDRAYKANSVHDRVDIHFVPADNPALRPAVAFFAREAVNGRVVRKLFSIISENDEGIFILKPHNFTDRSRFGNTIPDPADLADIKTDDLISPPKECEVAFTEVEKGVYTGTWPDCANKKFDGQHHLPYVITLTCSTMTIEVSWEKGFETSSLVPYIVRNYKRLPLPAAMTEGANGWVPPC